MLVRRLKKNPSYRQAAKPVHVALDFTDGRAVLDRNRELGGVDDSISHSRWATSHGTERFNQALAGRPDPEWIERAQALVERVSTELDLSTSDRIPQPALAGYRPRVGAYLAGRPNCMTRRVATDSELGPVRVVIDSTSSAGVPVRVVQDKGIASLALAVALSRIRPVELHQIAAGKANRADVIASTQLGCSPFDLTRCATVLGEVGWTRTVCYTAYFLSQDTTRMRGIPWPKEPGASLAQRAGIYDPAHDVFVPGLHLSESTYSGDNALAWIEKQLRLALKGEGAAAKSYA